MIGCLTETTTCVVAKPLVNIIGKLDNGLLTINCLYADCGHKVYSRVITRIYCSEGLKKKSY